MWFLDTKTEMYLNVTVALPHKAGLSDTCLFISFASSVLKATAREQMHTFKHPAGIRYIWM
jgi:hypothetical protein